MTSRARLVPSPRPARARSATPLERLEPRVLLATFTVTNVNNTGAGSLHQAVLDANAAAGADTICFNIPAVAGGVYTIRGPIPAITGPTHVDATTQSGYAAGRPVVQLLGIGTNAATVYDGLWFQNAGQSRVRGMIINAWAGSGIRADGNTAVTIEGNWIGIAADGLAPRPNKVGITIASNGGRVGGTTAAQRNIVSGNNVTGGVGIALLGDDNVVIGNYIGTNPDGTAPLPNSTGVRVEGSRNRVGGAAAGERNVISGNGTGVHTGKYVAWNPSVSVGNVVAGNYVGTNAAGTGALPNTKGMWVSTGSDGTIVGGTQAGAGNFISGNSADGLAVEPIPNSFAGPVGITSPINTRVEGNVIGLSASGNVLGNVTGIRDKGYSIIGGTTPATRNVISGNTTGIDARGSSTIQGNYIGLDPTGAAARRNTVGILLNAVSQTWLGGTAAGAGNVISGNTEAGIRVTGGPAGPNGGQHRIEGNYIGTNAAGTAAVRNGIGVEVLGPSIVMVGGDTPASRNVISGNGDGVRFISGVGFVRNNYIGTDAAGTARLGNMGHGVAIGVDIFSTSRVRLVADNVIAYNGGDGIRLAAGTVGNAFLSNLIHSNGGLNIDVGADGGTGNDPGDLDIGPNDRQNYPLITSVATNGTELSVRGTVGGDGTSSTFRVQFFAGPAFDAFERGEAATYLGEVIITPTPTSAAAEFAATLPAVPSGHYVSATVTTKRSDAPAMEQTSEFSQAFRVPPPDVVAPAVTGVFVRRNGWVDTFERHLERVGLGTMGMGFKLGSGVQQLQPLPWRGLDTITIQFSETVELSAADLVVGAAAAGAAAAPAAYAVSSFSTSRVGSAFTATWRLARPIGPDRISLVLNSSAVRDAARNALDGEWADAADSYPSGDGAPGGDFRFRFNVLPGDANRNGRVDAFDLAATRSRYGQAVTSGTATPRYSPFADFDGNGWINALDLVTSRRNLRDVLPA